MDAASKQPHSIRPNVLRSVRGVYVCLLMAAATTSCWFVQMLLRLCCGAICMRRLEVSAGGTEWVPDRCVWTQDAKSWLCSVLVIVAAKVKVNQTPREWFECCLLSSPTSWPALDRVISYLCVSGLKLRLFPCSKTQTLRTIDRRLCSAYAFKNTNSSNHNTRLGQVSPMPLNAAALTFVLIFTTLQSYSLRQQPLIVCSFHRQCFGRHRSGEDGAGLDAGEAYVWFCALTENFNIDCFTMTTSPAPEGAYRGDPAVVPGLIEAEEFDYGGEGVGYSDSTVVNIQQVKGNCIAGEGVRKCLSWIGLLCVYLDDISWGAISFP